MNRRVFLILVIVTAIGSAVWHRVIFKQKLLDWDAPYYAVSTESLLRDGDLDITDNLTSSPDLAISRQELIPHEGFFAVSPQGRVVPKHSTLLPFLAVPFVGLLGKGGYLVCNLIVMVLLIVSVASLAGGTPAARFLAFGLFVTSSWLDYCFQFSNDLLCALCVSAAYAFARSDRWWLCGLLASLAVWSKVYAVVIVLPLAIVVLPAGWRAMIKTILAASVGLIPMLTLNHILYGGAFITGYDRDGRVDGDGFRWREHYSLFNQPFGTGLVNVLFDLNVGMLRTAPLWFLWPVGLAMILRQRGEFPKRFAVALALGACANVLLFAPYECWNATGDGNRFLFPAVALGGALLEPTLAGCLSRFVKWKNHSSRTHRV